LVVDCGLTENPSLYAQGHSEETARPVEMVRRSDPVYDVDTFRTQLQKPADRERDRDGLRNGGFSLD
jgi:hypothetical protein